MAVQFYRISVSTIAFMTLYLCQSAAHAQNKSLTNVQILYGENYKLGSDTRTIITTEHASSWSKGENHFFFDVTNPQTNSTTIYGELSPSLSAGKILNRDLSCGLIKDYRLTGTLEAGTTRAVLYGVGVDLNIPHFSFFKVNLYARDTKNVDGVGEQVTLVWRLPIEALNSRFVFSGFADFASAEGNRRSNQLYAPQFLFDLGDKWTNPESFYAGIEYQIWHNKAGKDDIDEAVVQLMIKMYF